MPLDYAQEHHPLWQKSANPVSHTSHVSLPAVMLATLASAAVLAGTTWCVGFDRVKLKIIHIAQNNASEAFLPGMLVSVHAKEPDAKQCKSCHKQQNKNAEKCADCHNPRYYGLYFDWQKSIARDLKSRLSLIKSLEGNDNGQRERITAKINIAEKIGFHNIQLSRKLLEDKSQ